MHRLLHVCYVLEKHPRIEIMNHRIRPFLNQSPRGALAILYALPESE